MRLGSKRKGFTLAEIMVVLLVLTIIFAAMAPLITKRRTTASGSSQVWDWVIKDGNYSSGPMDAYYYSGDPNHTGELFFGSTPNNKGAVSSTYAPLSRLVIRSGPVNSSKVVQRQMMFRYGSGNGKFAGTMFLDGKNILFGGAYPFSSAISGEVDARNNTAIGYMSLNKLTTGDNNTAFGAYALELLTSAKSNTAVGFKAGNSMSGNYNTIVGALAGSKSVSGNNNTFVGYNVAGNSAVSGYDNVFIGAYSGYNVTSGYSNVGIGYSSLYSLTSGYNNVAVGANALKNLTSGYYNTAIGYNACSNVTSGSYKTCIGANSGPQTGSSAENYLKGSTDSGQRTYIGGKPYYYGGDAVLEIHNAGGTQTNLFNAPTVKANTTTVINGNLVVRGKAFFTIGNKLYALHGNDVHGSGDGGPENYGAYSGKGVCVESQTSYNDWKSYCPELYETTTSDRRLKDIAGKNKQGLKEINKLKVYNFTFKDDKDKTPQISVVAQELKQVFPNSVFKDADGFLKIRWDEMFYASINAIKELDIKIVSIIKRATRVESQIAQLERENVKLKTEVSALSARVEKLKSK